MVTKNIKSPLLEVLRKIRKSLIKDKFWISVRRTQISLTNIFVRIAAKFNGFELVPAPLTYNQDGLATRHNCDFLRDKNFLKAYSSGVATGSWGANNIEWRVFVVCWAAQHAMHLDGDFVECGVNRGGLARSVIDFVGFEKTQKTFYLLDTFCGLVDRCISPEERSLGKKAGEYSECYQQVCNTFRDFSNVVIIRGVVPDTLPSVKADHIAFLSIDMNCVEPEIATGDFFLGKAGTWRSNSFRRLRLAWLYYTKKCMGSICSKQKHYGFGLANGSRAYC